MLYATKPFPFSRDGVTLEYAVEGQPVDLPEGLVAGLLAEDYVTKDMAVPENKGGGFTREDIAAMGKADVLELLDLHGWAGDKRLGVDKLRAELAALMFVDL